jgi:hypothetical protein
MKKREKKSCYSCTCSCDTAAQVLDCQAGNAPQHHLQTEDRSRSFNATPTHATPQATSKGFVSRVVTFGDTIAFALGGQRKHSIVQDHGTIMGVKRRQALQLPNYQQNLSNNTCLSLRWVKFVCLFVYNQPSKKDILCHG